MLKSLESKFSWMLVDLKLAKKNPAELGIQNHKVHEGGYSFHVDSLLILHFNEGEGNGKMSQKTANP